MGRTDDPHPYIHRLRAIGMSDALIRERLILEGWDSSIVDPIFIPRTVATAAPPTTRIPADVLPKPRKRTLPFVSALVGLFAVSAIGTSTYLYLQPPVVYSISLASASGTAPLEYGALPALSDPDYYERTKEAMIAEKASFINADLSAMVLSVYTDGAKVLEVPILSKGKPGSWWETPAGIYKIESKTENGWSTFGEVHMPYSMKFQGNFFIHGWPYYPDGTPVASTYSGGCVRLSTEDAEKIFELARMGMPILVYTTEEGADDFNYQLKAPDVSAAGYLVADVQNGTVLTSKSASNPAPIASITKLVTALVATEYINLDKEITIPSSSLVYTSIPRLRAGSEARAYDLLFLLMQESSNEAAEALASVHGRERFVSYMNSKAKAINMTHTLFTDPSGAKSDLSTPEDLFTLLRYIRDNRRFVFELTTGELTNTAYGELSFRNIRNFNIIPKSSYTLLGGKVGQTNEAGETYAGVFEIGVGSERREIAVVVLGSRDAYTDVRKLLDFVRTTYAPGEIVAAQ